MYKILNILASLAFVTGLFMYGQYEFLDSLVVIATWVILTFLCFAAAVMLFGGLVVSYVGVGKTTNMKREHYVRKWYSIPLTVLWVIAFAYAGFTVAAIVYILAVILLYQGMNMIRTAIDKESEKQAACFR